MIWYLYMLKNDHNKSSQHPLPHIYNYFFCKEDFLELLCSPYSAYLWMPDILSVQYVKSCKAWEMHSKVQSLPSQATETSEAA